MYGKIRDTLYDECQDPASPEWHKARSDRAFEAHDELSRAMAEGYPGNFQQRYSQLFPKTTGMLVDHFKKNSP